MELRHLESFVAVAEELNFSRAADRLHIAQSPLSQRIKALEGELGVRLFARTNRRVTLTDAGATILAEARATLRAAEATRRAAHRAREGEAGVLRLGFVASAAFFHLPEILRGLRTRTPDVAVELLRLNSAAQADALFADRIDVGLARTPPDDDRIRSRPLAPEPLLAAVASDHRCAASRAIGLADLAEDPWILPRRGTGPSDLVDRILHVCGAAGFTPHVAHEAPDLPSVIGLVAGGLGASLVPLGIARLRVPGATSLVLRDQDRATLPATLIWHADRIAPVARHLVNEPGNADETM